MLVVMVTLVVVIVFMIVVMPMIVFMIMSTVSLFVTPGLVLLLTIMLIATVAFTALFAGTIPGRVDLVVPAVGHEIDRSSAGVVFATMLRPMSFMAGRHVQVEGRQWLSADDYRRGHSYNSPRQKQLGRGEIANGELTVQARCVQIDGNTYVTRKGQRLDGKRCGGAPGDADDPA